jgi:hypothetical protein
MGTEIHSYGKWIQGYIRVLSSKFLLTLKFFGFRVYLSLEMKAAASKSKLKCIFHCTLNEQTWF